MSCLMEKIIFLFACHLLLKIPTLENTPLKLLDKDFVVTPNKCFKIHLL